VIKENHTMHPVLARGVVLQEDGKIIVYYGQHEIDGDMNLDHLDTHQLMRIYNSIEEAVYDWEAGGLEI